MPRTALLRAIASLLAGGAAAVPAVAAVSPLPGAGRGLQAYVAGRVAAAAQDHALAGRQFEMALRADGADASVRARAFDAALVSGDRVQAVRLAGLLAGGREGAAAAGGPRGFRDAMPALVLMADAAARSDWRAFDRARAGLVDPFAGGSGPALLSTILDAHALAARGRHAEALARLDQPRSARIAQSYFAEHRAHLLVLARRWPEAAAALAALVEGEGAEVSRLRVAAAAAALEAAAADPQWRGRAIALLGGGAAADPVLAAARARLAASPRLAGRQLGGLVEGPADAIGLLFLRLSVDLARERNPGIATGFARLATLAAPGMAEAWLVASDTLAAQGLTELALAALDRVAPDGPLGQQARWRRAALLSAAGRHAEARAALLPLLEPGRGGLEDWVRLADVERAAENHDGTAEAISRALALVGGDPRPEHAFLFFLRGAALEQSGRFADAEPDLRRAVELQPDNAIYLNYLGYSLLDRNLKLDEAEALIARAYAAQPENGAIIDSMGWAAFVRGRYEDAVALLEKARAAEPADPTVADHLGDALWRVGRRIEARHAWAAAQALDPPPRLRAAIEAKLAVGLDEALAAR